jgi:hypothetical protein
MLWIYIYILATGLPRVSDPWTEKVPGLQIEDGVGQTRSRAGKPTHRHTLKKEVAFPV